MASETPGFLQDEADKLGVDISQCGIEDPATSQQLDKYVQLLCEARKHKVQLKLAETSRSDLMASAAFPHGSFPSTETGNSH